MRGYRITTAMKKLISILLTAVMVFGAVPFSAFASPIDYNTETSAEQATQGDEAELTAVSLPSGVPATDPDYGTLVYYEDFEDGDKGNAYLGIPGSHIEFWSQGDIVDNPVGDGKALINTSSYLQVAIAGDYKTDVTKVTFVVDMLDYGKTNADIPVNFMDNWLSPWFYWTKDRFSSTAWTTKTVSQDVTCTASYTNMRFYVGGKGMYFDNIKVYLQIVEKEAEHTAKPDAYSEQRGNLVYFNNFSGADFGNTADVRPLGIGSTVIEIAGKKAVAIDSSTMEGSIRTGCLIKAADGTTFKYTDGRAMKGKFYLSFELHNGTAKDYTYFQVLDRNPGGWDSWENVYTAWRSRSAKADNWTTMEAEFGGSQNYGAFGFINTNNLGSKISLASISVYFKPDSFVKLSDGKATRLLDLVSFEEVTLPEPADATLKGWSDGEGNSYIAGEKVAVSKLSGKTLTAAAVKTGKVEYSDGSTVYVKLDGDSAVHTVKTDNYPKWDMGLDGTIRECVGWAETENATVAVSTVTVTESGVRLYPVWKITAEAVDYEIAVSGNTKIELDNVDRTYDYKAVFTPAIEYNDVTWSVDDTSVATIDKDGVLTPVKPGTVKVKATADYYPRKSGEMTVEISYKNGFEPITVSFDGDVDKLPTSFTVIPGKTIDLSSYLNVKPTASGKLFNGWILNGDKSVVYTDKVTATSSDMTFTALVNYDINFALPHSELNAWYNYGTLKKENGVWSGIPNMKNNDNFLEIGNLAIPSGKFNAVEWYLDVNYTSGNTTKQFKVGDSVQEFYYHTPAGSYKGCLNGKVTAITDDGKYAVITVDLNTSSWSGTVRGMRFDLCGDGYYGYNFRYVRFIEKPTLAESVVTINGITAPVTGFAPDTTAAVAERYAQIDSITWKAENDGKFLSTGNFDENTVYTVTVTVSSADTTHIFGENVTAVIDGVDAVVSYDGTGAVIISRTYDATDDFIDFEMTIDGRTEISRTDRSFAYKLAVSEQIPDTTAVWSIDNTDIATMSDDGKLLVKKNGKLTVTAVSNYNPEKSATLDVEIKNLDVTYVTVSFDKATGDSVSGMPSDFTAQAGKIVLPDEKPTREGHIFIGWTESLESTATVDTISADADTTLYALWGVGIIWDFNNTKDGFSVDAATATTHETYLEVKTGSGSDDIRMYSPAFEADPKRYNKAIIRLSVEKPGMAQIYYSTDGSGINEGRSLKVNYTGTGLDDWQSVVFDFSSKSNYTSANKITKFWVDPFQHLNTTAYIDYICLLDNYRTVTFDANGGTLPEKYKDGVLCELGSKMTFTEKATADGKEFLGWSPKTDGSELANRVVVRENMTVYASYGEKAGDSFVLSDGEALLVKAGKNTIVKINYKADGEAKSKTVSTNENGYAVVELETGVEITDISFNVNAEATIMSEAAANEIANTVIEKEPVNSDILINGKPADGSGGTGKKQFDTTVTDVTKPGTLNTAATDENGDVTAAVDFAKGENIFFGFDEDYQKTIFTQTEGLERGYEPESVLSYRIFTKSTGASVTAEMFIDNIALDTSKVKYIILRARAIGFENPNLRIFFTNENQTTYTKLASVVHTLSDEYSVVVYDMSANKSWNGTVDSLRFVSENNSTGSIDFDWIYLTDEIPENTTEFNGFDDVFAPVNTEKMPFADVASNEWSYKEIARSYKCGFVNGKGENTFAPNDNVTLAEAITLAVRINTTFNGKAPVANSTAGNWYDSYVAAAITAKIIKPSQFDNYDRPATRRETAMIMKNAVPTYYLDEINVFDEIPDVDTKSDGAKDILALYRAGVVIGSDSEYSFMPDTEITRAELSAIVNRLAFPSARKRVYTTYERLADRIIYRGTDLAGIVLWSCTGDYFKLDDKNIGRTTSKGTDPIVLLHNATGSFDGKEVNKIILGIAYDKDEVKLAPEIYYATASANSYSWGRRVEGVLGETDEDGVTEVTFDFSNQSAFKDTVTQLRFDPFDADGKSFGLAYIIIE